MGIKTIMRFVAVFMVIPLVCEGLLFLYSSIPLQVVLHVEEVK